jgi:uncharacterized protein
MSQAPVTPIPEPDDLPPYTYTPGVTPHPVTDPRGHSFGQSAPRPDGFDPQHWWLCEPFVRGIVLFNRGYYWEAHEEWESVWHAVGRKGPIADFLKGLIKWAAAGVKAREGRFEGVARHLHRAAELLASARQQIGTSVFAGQPLDEIVAFIATEPSPSLTGRTDGRPVVFWTLGLAESAGPILTNVTDVRPSIAQN